MNVSFHLFYVLSSQLLQPFCGFEVQDVQKSEIFLLHVKDENPKADSPGDDNTCDVSKIDESQLQEPKSLQLSENQSHDETDKIYVAEIVDKVVDNALDDNGNGKGDGDAPDQNANFTTERIVLPKDDPETLLFLSYS